MLLGYLLLWHLRLFVCKLSALHGTALNTPSTQSSRCSFLLLSSPVCALSRGGCVSRRGSGSARGDPCSVPRAVQRWILHVKKTNKQKTKHTPPFFFFFIYLLVRLEAAGVNVLQWPLQHAQSGCLHSPSRTDAGKIETCLSFDFYNFIPRQPIY